MLTLLLTAPAAAFDSGRAAFDVHVNDIVIPYTVFAVFALPGERLEIEIRNPSAPSSLESGTLTAKDDGSSAWLLFAPDETGVYPVEVRSGAHAIRLNLVVMVPAGQVAEGILNGYRIGSYPVQPLRGNPAYLPPEGYIELTPDNADVRVSPHFTLGQFPAKQSDDYPRYLVLRESLLLKLELLLEEVNRHGIAAGSFVVMSGYRTPFYNASIGNVPSSRHVYGGAADVYVDVAPRDGTMDDLNGDGRSDLADAQTLYRWANRLFARPGNRHLAGGLGVYSSNRAHGPFLHMDARGHDARWGMLP